MAEDFSELNNRELDALVAERVMGWLHVPVGHPPQLAWLSSKWSSCIEEGPPHYSTDANAALAVLEKLRDQWRISLTDPSRSDQYLQGRWEALLEHHDSELKHIAEHASLPRAICLAALAAQPKEPSDVRT